MFLLVDGSVFLLPMLLTRKTFRSRNQPRRVFEEIWSYLEIIEREGGFFTYDPQIGRVLDLQKDFEAPLGCYDCVSRDISEEFAAQQKKPWWRFWN